ncbi:MAG: hypothetical protein LBS56_09000 [Propionibacteriaceae bacterium]|jgi:hypothetical protein|nr:hypothetical protein [Propionibacteriaceae bacterium]
MRRLIHAVAALLLLPLAACAGAEPTEPPASQPGEATVQSDDPVEQSPADEAATGVYQKPGQELGDFYDAFSRAFEAHWQAIADYETEQAMTNFESDDLYAVGNDYTSLWMSIGELALYDDVSGVEILCPDCGYFRQVDGAVISYGKSHVSEAPYNPSPDPLEQAGDVITAGGTLDTASNTLLEERKVERAGEVVARTVAEVILESETSLVVQVFQLPLVESDENPDENVGTAMFARVDADRMDFTVAQLPRDLDFAYRSIADDPGATVADMSRGLTPIRQVTVEAGEVTVTKF